MKKTYSALEMISRHKILWRNYVYQKWIWIFDGWVRL